MLKVVIGMLSTMPIESIIQDGLLGQGGFLVIYTYLLVMAVLLFMAMVGEINIISTLKYTHGIAKTSEYYDNANNFTIHIQAMDLKMKRCTIIMQTNVKKKNLKFYVKHSKIEYAYKIF